MLRWWPDLIQIVLDNRAANLKILPRKSIDSDGIFWNQIIEFKINTPISPNKEIIVSKNVHEKKVCFRERLKNSLNIQNAVSFTCDMKHFLNQQQVPLTLRRHMSCCNEGGHYSRSCDCSHCCRTDCNPYESGYKPCKTRVHCHCLLNDRIFSCTFTQYLLKTPPAVVIT